MDRKITNILVVDDEQQILRLLKTSLAAHHARVFEATTAAEALDVLGSQPVDLMLLDIGLPDRSGLEILALLRMTSNVPIIILSVQNDDNAKVEAFDLGADDYLAKPFSTVELAARIRSVLRRRARAQDMPTLVRCGDLTVDVATHRVTRGGREIKLSRTEYSILVVFAEHCGKVLTHDFLMQRVWGAVKHKDLQYLRVYIRSLRNKLGDRIGEDELIRTEPRIGYRLAPPSEADTRIA